MSCKLAVMVPPTAKSVKISDVRIRPADIVNVSLLADLLALNLRRAAGDLGPPYGSGGGH